MNDDMRRRLAKLERHISTEPVRLTLPDGSTREIASSRQHWDVLREFSDMQRRSSVPVLNSGPARELAWLREAVTIEEPRGQMFALLAVMERGAVPRGQINS